MKISPNIRDEFGADLALDPDAGMRAKSEEFAAQGNRGYLPVVD
ncbi:hypothetical protein ABIA32_000172 [Streptacidiphilus sp. MAP12-20]